MSISFSVYNLGKFKEGQFDITEECKSKSDTGKIVSINDGDVTTYIYEKPEYFRLDELRGFVAESFGEGYGSYIATYREDADGNIFVLFNGSVDGTVDDLETVRFLDEDGDEEYFEIFTGDKSELLTTNAFMSSEDVLKAYPHLKKEKEL